MNMKRVRFILATRNKGKLIEFQKLLPEIDLICMDDIEELKGLRIEEDGKTFLENAIKKAKTVANISRSPSIADDSGLVVYALGGRPGIYSSRFAGEDATDLENNLKLLKEMEGIKDRRASFICVIAVSSPKGKIFTYEGRCEGIITEKMIGDKGFGYDPLFYYPPLRKTFAQMDTEEKNKVSHRAIAIRKLRDDLPNIIKALEDEACR